MRLKAASPTIDGCILTFQRHRSTDVFGGAVCEACTDSFRAPRYSNVEGRRLELEAPRFDC
ncbi:hypothetical protein SynNOUM97013_01190 [Synechococcus sp. NOUM97013]|nr:hypothetical protein SynNOUM97013_01190 [Synechococcus sp. NOUM97013]